MKKQQTCKIPLTKIRFGPRVTRPVTEALVKNLVEVYKRVGCCQLQYPIPGCVTRPQLHSLSQQLEGADEGVLGISNFSFEEVTCFHGLHRVEAAKRFLIPAKQWWAVDLYVEDELTDEDRRKLTQQADIGAAYEDGIILQFIILYRVQANKEGEEHWWALLTPTKKTVVERLLRFAAIENKLRELVGIPGVWHGIKLGATHSISIRDLVPVSKHHSPILQVI